jgi:hypothetical protein
VVAVRSLAASMGVVVGMCRHGFKCLALLHAASHRKTAPGGGRADAGSGTHRDRSLPTGFPERLSVGQVELYAGPVVCRIVRRITVFAL